MTKVLIIDYKMGNIDSIYRAIDELGGNPFLGNKTDDFNKATHIILPGVGSFNKGMSNIISLGIDENINEYIKNKKKPLLGICLGMQLLSEKGFEGGEIKGLSLVDGEVLKLIPIKEDEKIPHIGWNEVYFNNDSPITYGLDSGKDFYFVHSYHFKTNDLNVIGWTPYCNKVNSIIQKENIFGTQFHPEKSQKYGFKILKNFVDI